MAKVFVAEIGKFVQSFVEMHRLQSARSTEAEKARNPWWARKGVIPLEYKNLGNLPDPVDKSSAAAYTIYRKISI